MDKEESLELTPKKQSLFPLSAEDIVDNALENLTEAQANASPRKRRTRSYGWR